MGERMSDAQRRRLAGILAAESVPDTPSGSSPGEAALMLAGSLAGPAGARAAQYGPKALGALLATLGFAVPTEANSQVALRGSQQRQLEMEARRKQLEADAARRSDEDRLSGDIKRTAAEAEQNRINQQLERELQTKIDEQNRNKTFAQKYPGIADALPGLGLIVGAGVPAIGKVLSQRNRNAPMRDWNAAVRETEDALGRTTWTGKKNPNVQGAGDGLAKLDQFNAAYPKGTLPSQKELPVYQPGRGMIAAGLFGGSAAAEASMFADQWNAINLPETNPERAASRARALDPLNYLERGAMGALTGSSGYKAGNMFYPDMKGQVERSKGLVARYGTTAGDVSQTMIRDAETQRLLSASGRGPRSRDGGSAVVAPGSGPQAEFLPPSSPATSTSSVANPRAKFPLTISEELELKDRIVRQLMQR